MCKTDIKITPADIEKLEGVRPRTAQRRVKDLKEMAGKYENWQWLTFNEYCDLTENDPDEIKQHLNMK